MSSCDKTIQAVVLFAALAPAVAYAQEVPGCGFLVNAFGPFDYRDPSARDSALGMVEGHHFTTKVESLAGGISGPLIADIDYTLRAFPNHHRALNSVARFALQGGRFLSTSIPSADCFFLRAITFRPDDEVVRMIYANYLVKRGNVVAAKKQYDEALRIAPGSAEVSYNAGLFYLSMGDVARA